MYTPAITSGEFLQLYQRFFLPRMLGLPAFYARDLVFWLVLLDLYFHINHVSSELLRYNHASRELPPSLLAKQQWPPLGPDIYVEFKDGLTTYFGLELPPTLCAAVPGSEAVPPLNLRRLVESLLIAVSVFPLPATTSEPLPIPVSPKFAPLALMDGHPPASSRPAAAPAQPCLPTVMPALGPSPEELFPDPGPNSLLVACSPVTSCPTTVSPCVLPVAGHACTPQQIIDTHNTPPEPAATDSCPPDAFTSDCASETDEKDTEGGSMLPTHYSAPHPLPQMNSAPLLPSHSDLYITDFCPLFRASGPMPQWARFCRQPVHPVDRFVHFPKWQPKPHAADLQPSVVHRRFSVASSQGIVFISTAVASPRHTFVRNDWASEHRIPPVNPHVAAFPVWKFPGQHQPNWRHHQ
ncbi:uncharacterized protein LOC144119221 [Amblyomma americanum]